MKRKTLYLIRHAKAEEHSFKKRDHDRNLIQQGKEKAERVAKELAGKSILTLDTIVISSTANRTIQTAILFCDTLQHPEADIQQEKSIYEAHFLDILTVINAVPDTADTVILFGHNPGLSDLTNYLCGTYVDLRPSDIAVIALPEDFSFAELSNGAATLKEILS